MQFGERLKRPNFLLARFFGTGYRLFRRWIIIWYHINSYFTGRILDFEDLVAKGDQKLTAVRLQAPRWIRFFDIPHNLTTEVHGLRFPSPLTAAAFKADQDILKLWLDLGIGSVIVKTILPEPRIGNSKPRLLPVKIHRKPGFVNALGLPGPGIDKFIENMDWTLFHHHRPIGISLGGNSPEDYRLGFDAVHQAFLDRTEAQHLFIELNISCPNTPEGQDLSRNPQLLKKLLSDLRSEWDVVLSIKVPPDLSNDNLFRIGEIVAGFPDTIINAGNTRKVNVRELGINNKRFVPDLAGLSGKPIYERTLEMIELLKPLNVPIIATGGIETPQQARDVLNSGAALIGMATGLVKNMYRIPEINFKLSSSSV